MLSHQLKISLLGYTAIVYIRQVGTAEDTIQNIYDNILHVVPVNMPESFTEPGVYHSYKCNSCDFAEVVGIWGWIVSELLGLQ